MNRSLAHTTVRALFALAALTAGTIAVGCSSEVQGGGEGGGGGSNSEACTKVGDVKDCTDPGFTSECVETNGELRWTACTDSHGMTSSSTSSSVNSGAASTPLVLSFDGAPVQMTADASHGFTLNAASSASTDWPTAKTPWLALDVDGSGVIEDGRELFGSMTTLKNGSLAKNGFVALRELDADGDGKITAADPGFAKLLLWSDRDGDRRSTAHELTTAASAELISIDLDYTSEPRCDARGNCEIERASFRYRDAAGAVRTGTIIDVHLPAQRW